jgi:hypothetical protein
MCELVSLLIVSLLKTHCTDLRSLCAGTAGEQVISSQLGKERVLRFKVGDKATARITPTQWADVIVVATNFTHPEMPAGMVVPYQLKVESTGDVVVCPHDVPEIIVERGSAPPIRSVLL